MPRPLLKSLQGRTVNSHFLHLLMIESTKVMIDTRALSTSVYCCISNQLDPLLKLSYNEMLQSCCNKLNFNNWDIVAEIVSRHGRFGFKVMSQCNYECSNHCREYETFKKTFAISYSYHIFFNRSLYNH